MVFLSARQIVQINKIGNWVILENNLRLSICVFDFFSFI